MTDVTKLRKKKKRLIIVIIILAVLLVADIVGFVIFGRGSSSATSGFDPSNMPSGFDSSSMPSGFDPSSMPQRSSGDSSSGDTTQESFNPGSMPEGFNPMSAQQGDTSGDVPSGFDPSNMPGNMPSGKNPFSLVFIVVGAVLVLIEIILAIVLARTCKKIKKSGNAEADTGEAEAIEEVIVDPVELRKRKQKKDRITLGAVLAIILVIVILLVTLGNRTASSQSVSVEETVREATAESGTVSKTLKGSGVIAATDETDVAIAGNISVTKYYVSEGDVVSKGDIIAAVDQNSVMAAIGNIETLLEKIDAKMMEVKEDSESTSVTSPAAARVVKIYAEADDDVVDVMYNHGALMLLSLDGCLAVDVPNAGGLTTDTTVNVIGDDGESHEGVITAIAKDTVTVKVSMDDFSYEESVTVKTTDGATELGSGELYISNKLAVTGYSGTVGTIKVKENAEVKEDAVLLTLEGTDYTATYKTLISKRTELENQLNTLIEIADTGYVYATSDGTVSDLDSTLVVSSNAEATDAVQVSVVAYEKDYIVAAGNPDSADNSNVPDNSNAPENAGDSDDSDSSGNLGTSDDQENGGSADVSSSEVTTKSVAVIWLDQNNGVPVTVDLLQGETVVDTVTLSNETGWEYTWINLPKMDGETEIEYSIFCHEIEGYTTTLRDIGTVTGIINVPKSSSSQTPGADTPGADIPGSDTPGTDMPGTDTPGTDIPGSDMPSGDTPSGDTPSGQMPSGNMPSGMQGSFSNNNFSSMFTGNTSATVSNDLTNAASIITQVEETYSLSETVICKLTPNDQVSISVTIDELDINYLKVGQECQVTLDALLGQSFTGTIVRRNSDGENSGGNTKYTVTVTMDKTESMLLGMNASISIPLEEKTGILTISEDALVEQDGHTYVYTSYDEKKDELSGLTEVTTGISDGMQAEITSGLEEGTTVYYKYAGSIIYKFN